MTNYKPRRASTKTRKRMRRNPETLSENSTNEFKPIPLKATLVTPWGARIPWDSVNGFHV